MRRGLVHGGAVLAGVAGSAALCSPAFAQENRFDVSVSVVETYDSNILRLSPELSDGPRDNLALSPRVGVDYGRRFGRQRLFLNGTAGYNYNSRFRFLNREDLTASGGANLSFSGRCRADPTASLLRSQADLDDLGDAVGNTVTIQEYTVQAACPRSAGLYPTVSAGLLRVDNSAIRRERNQSVVDGRAGLVYRRPSLGDAELFTQFILISRNREVPTATGVVKDDSDVSTIGLRLSRDVGTRVAASASVGYTNVDPKVPGVAGFSGVTYRGAVTYQPQPRLSFTAGFGRAVSSRGNAGTSYFVTRSADLGAQARLSARTSVGARVQLATRDFRGEDRSFRFGPRGADSQLSATGNVSYAISAPVALNLTALYRRRDADNDFYDYSTFSATLGASLRL